MVLGVKMGMDGVEPYVLSLITLPKETLRFSGGKKVLLFLVAVTPKDRSAWILPVVLILTRMTEEFGIIVQIKSSARHPSPVSFSSEIIIGASHSHAQQLFP